jgi:hypothetical protein
MQKKTKEDVPRGLTLLEALNTPATPIHGRDKEKKTRQENNVVKLKLEAVTANNHDNGVRTIIADPQTETTVLNVLRISQKTFSQLVEIASEITVRTRAIDDGIRKNNATKKENDLVWPATPAVVLFNVIHSIGILATRIDTFRREMKLLQKAEGLKKKESSSDFDKIFAVYLAHRMRVDTDFLAELPEEELHVQYF